MALVLANIGNRDVLCDGQECRPARDRGGEILNAYIGERERLSFPIFGRALEHLQKDLGERRQDLEVVLFVTDQADPAHRSTDTVEFGRIIKKHFGASVKISLEVINQSPHAYDIMFALYGERLSAIRKKHGRPEKVYVLATGGAPACNMALLFHSIALYGEVVKALYVEPARPVTSTTIAEQLVESFARRTFLSHVNSHDYSAAVSVGRVPENARLLAEAAQARLNFDFVSAYGLLRRVRGAEPARTDILIPVENHLARILENDDPGDLLRELAVNMEIKYRARQYADLLGRLFRFEEALLEWAVSVYGNIRAGKRAGGEYPEFIEGIRANDGLEDYLKTRRVDGSRMRYAEPSRMVLREITRFLVVNKNGSGGGIGAVLECADAISAFSDLRNRSIIAHGFKGISLSDLEALGITAVFERIGSIVPDTSGISFAPINACIARILGGEIP